MNQTFWKQASERLALALEVPLSSTGTHIGICIFYESPLRDFQVKAYIAEDYDCLQIQWNIRELEKPTWYWQDGYGFWGNKDPLPDERAFGRIMYVFGRDTDFLSYHEKLELQLDMPCDNWRDKWLEVLAA